MTRRRTCGSSRSFWGHPSLATTQRYIAVDGTKVGKAMTRRSGRSQGD
jgi:hypothetical protein